MKYSKSNIVDIDADPPPPKTSGKKRNYFLGDRFLRNVWVSRTLSHLEDDINLIPAMEQTQTLVC